MYSAFDSRNGVLLQSRDDFVFCQNGQARNPT